MKTKPGKYVLIGGFVSLLTFLQFSPFLFSTYHFVSETVSITDIRNFDLRMDGHVFLIQGEEPRVILEGPSSLVKRIILEPSGDKLTIKVKKSAFRNLLNPWLNPDGPPSVCIYVIVTDLNNVYITGPVPYSLNTFVKTYISGKQPYLSYQEIM